MYPLIDGLLSLLQNLGVGGLLQPAEDLNIARTALVGFYLDTAKSTQKQGGGLLYIVIITCKRRSHCGGYNGTTKAEQVVVDCLCDAQQREAGHT